MPYELQDNAKFYVANGSWSVCELGANLKALLGSLVLHAVIIRKFIMYTYIGVHILSPPLNSILSLETLEVGYWEMLPCYVYTTIR